jgi:2-hydroxychromene-2-carboxylate isomerase
MTTSIKSLLMPAISQRLLSRERLLRQRARIERARRSRGEPHVLHYFHQIDDPYSALAAATLPRLAARYDIHIAPHVVGPPPDSAAPERDKLVAYSRKDAQLLAEHWGLDFRDAHRQPASQAVQRATCLLVAAADAGRFVESAAVVSTCLWRDAAQPDEAALAQLPLPVASPAAAASHVAAASAMRRQLGHYLGATFFYGGEWYWGIDRMHHMEQRLQDLGAQRAGVVGLLFPPNEDLNRPVHVVDPPSIDFFVSLRSPYSAIVTPRVFNLGRLTGAPVRLRFVLPMVMRGLPVPREKRRYISLDAAREAFVRGIDFGRVNDPLGRPTERGLALIPFANRAGKGQEYLLSFMRGVWAEGIDAGSDRGLRRIVERAGLSWNAAGSALNDETWRKTAEDNRAEMFALGLWGVPSFRVRDTAVWGQDRLWAVQQALLGDRNGLARSSL